ncbi:MAG: HEAT repeat domain-containing protein [Planctomycetales bacterium]|nr:HEAT repeat domain-containing protein [Planctomycetales bacterium]
MKWFRSLVFLLALSLSSVAWGEDPPPPQEPQIAAASQEAEQAISGFKVPADLKVQVFAAEPLLANPVAFFIDNRGRFFVCETFRQTTAIADNRNHGEWLDEDLAAQTVADRLAYIQRHLKEKAVDYTRQDDRIRLLEDADGDGKADKASVFAAGFNKIEEGTGAGVLVRGDDVFYTNIPNLWRLKDKDHDGKADERTVLHTGYGVRFAFRGHDMHGLILGPDGRLYFSIGDRGFNVKTQEGKQIVHPQCGAVLRCELDGSKLEVFATGLRNPQELAFDDYGNLFTGDNNSDSGDQARWVYVVEGGDSGWRMEYQYLPDRGPFNREKIWHPAHEGQPAYIVPPVANLASGPSGLAFYPGTGLPEHYKNRFFLIDFRGTPANSGVRTFRVKPKGAGFEVADAEETLWRVLATDVDFGPDGAVYLTDWVNGWNGEGKGRIYRYSSPEVLASAEVQEVKKLLAGDFSKLSGTELVALIGHADRRVRQEAQFALAAGRNIDLLYRIVRDGPNLLARLHGIWGIAQFARHEKADFIVAVVPFLKDSESEVRAQSAKVLGDVKSGDERVFEHLLPLLKDESPRVRYFAAISLGKLGHKEALAPLAAMLEENNSQDAVLRHGGIMGLAGSAGSGEALVEVGKHSSPAVRLAAAVAMRKLGSEQVAMFLNDTEPLVVVEAARSIHDLPLEGALPKLAALITRSATDDTLMRRVLNANYRLGTPENANAIAAFAARKDAPDNLRLEALAMLQAWDKPSPKDRVLNFWRPLPTREREPAAIALRTNLPGIFSGSPKVQAEGAKVAAGLGIKEVGPALFTLLADKAQPPQTRADSLTALATLKDPGLEGAVETSLKDNAPLVRASARNVLLKLKPTDALAVMEEAVLKGEVIERQAALASLANFTQPGTNAIFSKALDELVSGNYPAAARLDLVEATRRRAAGDIKSKLAKYESGLVADDAAVLPYLDCQEGGDFERGRRIFHERTEVSCVRCHRVAGSGGDVGPDLTRLSADPAKTRKYLLESLVAPNKAIAKGFESVLILDANGQSFTGIIKKESDKTVELMTAEGKLVSLARDDIEQRRPAKSAMPDDFPKKLTKFDVRDLVEFLAILKEEPVDAVHK